MKFFSYYNLVSGTFVRYIIYFSLSFSVAANLKKVIDDPPSSKSMMFPLVSIAVHPCLLFSFMGLQTDKFPFLRSPPPPPRLCIYPHRVLGKYLTLCRFTWSGHCRDIGNCPYREVRMYVNLTLPYRPAKIPAKRLSKYLINCLS